MREVNVLVTGGAGYIGSHTAKELRVQGFQPVVYDNLAYGHRQFVKWGPFIEGDILDKEKLVEVMRQHSIKDVIHFAAFAYVGESVIDPSKYYQNNLVGSLALLEAMRTASADRIVFSSTCATYGEPETQPITETEDQRPINPYGRTKLAVENLLQDFALAYKIKSVALRYFNAAGADPAGEIGEEHDPETHLIPLAISALRNPEQPLKVFGKDYPTKDGTCVRDYIHVSDLASAHVNALRYLYKEESPSFSAFNLGTGRGASVLEVLKMLEISSQKKVPYFFTDRRPGDPPVLVANPSRAAEILGWRAKHDLQSIVTTALRWHMKES